MTTTNSDLGVEGKTIGEMFENRAKATPNAPAFQSKTGGAWRTKSWGEAYERAERIAFGLLASGLKLGERVAILAGTREEWTLADLALVMAGGVTVPLYPSNTAEQCAYILNDSESA